ncbi:MAG: methyltransferase [Bacteroidetes bacterium]|nr:methyltransferase [Bacteroidota bacterium]
MKHHRSTMKVGTDAVLLGAWTDVEGALRVLDAGTGSGILALMLAQRNSNALIDAIDVDEISVAEAAENFIRSPWSSRLKALHADLRTFQPPTDGHYDLIISNPPFFDKHIPGKNQRRNLARHTASLTYHDLLSALSRLLAHSGKASIVLPWQVGNTVRQLAADYGLHPARVQHIIPVENRPANRMHIELTNNGMLVTEETYFTIRRSDMAFTEAYTRLLKDFYLGLGE